MAATAKADEAYQIISTAVDQAFYWATNPELNEPGLDPVRHYLEQGWRDGRDPAPWFSVVRYLQAHPDVAASGEEPFTHYLRRGAEEDRAIFLSDKAGAYRTAGGEAWRYQPESESAAARARAAALPMGLSADRRIVATGFDGRFYTESNPDVAAAGHDPLEHFLVHGWPEGRDPAPFFSVRDYLAANPDVAKAGVNPFVHYLKVGRAEGRAPHSDQGFRYRIIASLTSLETRIARAAERALQASPDPDFESAAGSSLTGLKDLHITFSHDNFVGNLGGVQLCLQYESDSFAKLGRDHLHLYPSTTWPVLRRTEAALLKATLNGRPIGTFTAQGIAEALAARRGRKAAANGRGSFAIHNLLGHSVDEVLKILEAAGLRDGAFWLHDFTSLCAGYQLLRNDVQDCGAPPLDSPACGICFYGPGRMPQVQEHERLFHALRLTVVSPAQTTLDFWRASWSYPIAGALVHPHVRLAPRAAPAAWPEPGPLRLAFLGLPAAHKGWPIFAELAEEYAGDPRYRFLHLGARRDPCAAVEHHPVSVSLENPRAMQMALEALEVDVAVIWSLFRETFCLAAYEAVAAGAAIVTPPDSANVAAFVASGGHGRVLADEAALRRALARGELLDLARRVRKPPLYDLAFSGMTADLLEASAAA
jgi:hypothetical protein